MIIMILLTGYNFLTGNNPFAMVADNTHEVEYEFEKMMTDSLGLRTDISIDQFTHWSTSEETYRSVRIKVWIPALRYNNGNIKKIKECILKNLTFHEEGYYQKLEISVSSGISIFNMSHKFIIKLTDDSLQTTEPDSTAEPGN